MTRTPRWTLALLATLLAALLVGGQALAQDPPPTRGGSVVVAISADPPGWDPTLSTSQEIARVTYGNVFEGLVRFDRHGEIVPALATDWAVSDDGLRWTFALRQGVTFHDGSPLTVDDVIAKFQRARDPDSGHVNQGYYDAVAAVTSPDPGTIVFELTRPNRSLLYNLARPDAIVFPAALADTQRSRPVGTGPFRFARYVEGSEVRLERFEAYWNPDLPYLDAATFRIISDANARVAALMAGDVDLIGAAVPPEQVRAIEADPNLKVESGTATAEITVAMNNSRPPFDDLRVRQAITHAIDKRAIVDGAFFGLGTPIGTHMSPSEPYYVDLTDTYAYDPERARQLLVEAGFADGLRFDFELPEPYAIERRTGEVIAQQLREVGIDVNLSVVEWGTWIQRIFLAADYDMTIIGHSEPRDIDIYARPDYYYRYDNPRIAELLEEAESAPTAEAETAAYQEIARIIAEDAVNVWVFSPANTVAARADLYGYWTDQPTPTIDLTQVYRAR
jgi:peptide/nickel transport system substrate-binding protein